MRKKLRLLLLVLVLAVLFAGCSILETEQGNEIKGYCSDMIDSILADDPQGALAVMTDGVEEGAFAAFYQQVRVYLKDVTTYELVQKGWYVRTNNGQSTYEATFEMETNAETFYVTGVMAEGYDRLYHINIVPASQSGAVFTGTLTTMEGANGAQWAMLVLSAGMLGFVVWMLVDCCKRKIKLKPLWIVLILGGALVLSYTATGSEGRLNFNLGIFLLNYSQLRLYGSGDVLFQLVLPVGALLYLLLRKKLTVTPPVPQPVYPNWQYPPQQYPPQQYPTQQYPPQQYPPQQDPTQQYPPQPPCPMPEQEDRTADQN